EGIPRPGRLDDRDALLEKLPVKRVLVAPAVPRAGGLHPGDGGVVLEPARLVAAHERDVEPAAEQMVERRGGLAHTQGIVGGQDAAELVDAQARPVLAEEHRHEPGVLSQLEALDLQVVLWNADARPAGLIARARVLRDLVEHPLIEHRVLAGHAPLQLAPPADRHVHERVKVHGPARLPAPAAGVKLLVGDAPRARLSWAFHPLLIHGEYRRPRESLSCGGVSVMEDLTRFGLFLLSAPVVIVTG